MADMYPTARKLAWLVCLLPWLVAGCNQDVSSPIVVDEPADAPPVAGNASTENTEPLAAPSTKTTSAATPASQPAAEAPPAPAGPPKEVTFDTVKLALEKDQPFERSLLTPEVLAIDNRPIRIRGYILPSFQQTGIKQFVLVRDNQECCFGPGAALHDCIVVDMKPGETTEYTVRPVAVEGVFSIREMKGLDDKHLAIYHLDGESVE